MNVIPVTHLTCLIRYLRSYNGPMICLMVLYKVMQNLRIRMTFSFLIRRNIYVRNILRVLIDIYVRIMVQ